MFGFHGIWQGVAVLYDKSTRSLWLHLSGQCIDGPLKGAQLEPIPGRHVLWSQWKRDHPTTEVMAENEAFKEQYFPRDRAQRGRDFFPTYFLRTIQTKDRRLPPSALCFGVKTEMAARAYPFAALSSIKGGVVNDRVGEVPVVILYDKDSRSAAGHGRTLDGNILVFERSDSGLLRDQQTGSLFDRDGLAVRGRYEGRRLPAIFGLQAEWYGWYATYPETSVFQQQ